MATAAPSSASSAASKPQPTMQQLFESFCRGMIERGEPERLAPTNDTALLVIAGAFRQWRVFTAEELKDEERAILELVQASESRLAELSGGAGYSQLEPAPDTSPAAALARLMTLFDQFCDEVVSRCECAPMLAQPDPLTMTVSMFTAWLVSNGTSPHCTMDQLAAFVEHVAKTRFEGLLERARCNARVLTTEQLKHMTIQRAFSLVIAGTDWKPIFAEPKVKEGLEFVSRIFTTKQLEFVPPVLEVPTAFVMTSWASTRVVILGQDPYKEPGVPTGLAFSIRRGLPLTATLRNIYTVYSKTLGFPRPKHGCLISWALQGVLLINTSLTTQPGLSNAHTDTWRSFTDPFIRAISEKKPLIWVLWGKEAQKIRSEIKGSGHIFLEGPHPVAHDNSFLEVDHFRQINAALEKRKQQPIDWQLPE
jgi:uracil-DNA glycosylase